MIDKCFLFLIQRFATLHRKCLLFWCQHHHHFRNNAFKLPSEIDCFGTFGAKDKKNFRYVSASLRHFTKNQMGDLFHSHSVLPFNVEKFSWHLCTGLGSLMGKTQCENFWIFLPLRIYMKSILVIWFKWFEASITTILTVWTALNSEFLGMCDIFICKWSFLKSKFKAFKIVKTAVFDHLKLAKIDLMYNQSGRKMLNFHTV